MDIVLLIARLFLALIFSLAGATKAADLAAARKAAIGFGVPRKLAVPIGSCLPFVEILIALALLPINTAWLSAIAACALLLIFAGAIGANLVRGRKPDCNCFGQLHSRPVSWSDFGRNVALAAVAALIVARGMERPGLSAFNWLSLLRAGEMASLVLSIAVIGLLAIVAIYLRRIIRGQSTVLARLEALKKVIDEDYAELPIERDEAAGPLQGLPVGSPAPSFSLASMTGEQVTLENLLARRKPLLLLFVSPNCSPCKTVLESVPGLERDYRRQVTIALITKGGLNENQGRIVQYGASHVLLQRESGVAAEYDAKWTPAAVLIGPSGRMASRMTYGHAAIQALVTSILSPPDARDAGPAAANINGNQPEVTGEGRQSLISIGERVPSFSLRASDRSVVTSHDLLGLDTLLLFWNPKCPFCRDMSDDIARWEANPPRLAPRLVFVCSGDAEDVRAESDRFKSRFLHDPELTIGALFGTNATPSAVLIDAHGRIASAPEAGRVNVLALAGARRPAAVSSSGV